MQFTIQTSDTYSVMSRDVGVEVDLRKLTDSTIAKLVIHGLTQKIGDSAASAMTDSGFKGMKFAELNDADKAKVQAAAKGAMAATLDALYKGEWTERKAGGDAVSELVAESRVILGAWLRAEHKAVWDAKFKGLEISDRGPALDAFLAAQSPEILDAVLSDAKAAIAERAKRKAGLGKLALNIAL